MTDRETLYAVSMARRARRALRVTLMTGLFAAAMTLLLTHTDFVTSAFAEQNSWFGSDKTTTEKSKPAPAKTTEKKDTSLAKAAEGKAADFQTMEQLQKAGVKHWRYYT